MAIFKKIFHRQTNPLPLGGDREGASFDGDRKGTPLRVEGTHTHLTPEPDDAELAAEALLEMMTAPSNSPKGEGKNAAASKSSSPLWEGGRGLYYHQLADRIREAHRKSAQQATRFVAACEYKLQSKHLPYYGPGSLQLLEVELYKRIDIIEREGGELKSRWQHCLAEVTVRLMDAPPKDELSEPQNKK